jgi:hypothetical protein
MRSWEIFRFEIAYQSRRVSTWLSFAVLLTLTYYMTREIYIDNARSDGYFFNAPFVIAVMTFLGSMMGLLIATNWPAMRQRETCRRGWIRSSTPRPSARPRT